MSAIAAVRSAADALRRNPVLFVAAASFVVVSVPSYALQATRVPLAPALWSGVAFFVTPFLTGGLLGMAEEAVAGDTSLARFVAAGKKYYVSLLLVAVLVAVVVGGVVVFGVVLLAAVGAFVLGISSTGVAAPSGGAALVVAGLALAFAFVILLLAFVFQFVNQAVVLDDDGPVDAIQDSYWTVRHNLVGAFGVAVVGFVVSFLFTTVPVTVAMLAVQPGQAAFDVPLSRTAAYAVLFGWGTVSTVVFGAFVNTMLVAFYGEHGPGA